MVDKKGFREVKPGLWEPLDSSIVVKIDKAFAKKVYEELKTGCKQIDKKIKAVITQAQKASERFGDE